MRYKAAHLLALGAGGDDDLLVLGQALDPVDVHQGVLGHLHIAQLCGDLHDIFHGPARDGHLPAEGRGGIQHLLDSVDVGGEGGDDDPVLASLELALEGGAHRLFRGGKARTLHIGGSASSARTPSFPSSPKRARSMTSPSMGGGVDLEVAGVDDGAMWVWMAKATESAMEWFTWMNSTVNLPARTLLPGSTVMSLVLFTSHAPPASA